MLAQHPGLRLLPFFFFFNDTATTEIYTLSLHDALPISPRTTAPRRTTHPPSGRRSTFPCSTGADRKSTRLNSSHLVISYAVFCLKKKKSDTRLLPRTHVARGEAAVSAQ